MVTDWGPHIHTASLDPRKNGRCACGADVPKRTAIMDRDPEFERQWAREAAKGQDIESFFEHSQRRIKPGPVDLTQNMNLMGCEELLDLGNYMTWYAQAEGECEADDYEEVARIAAYAYDASVTVYNELRRLHLRRKGV